MQTSENQIWQYTFNELPELAANLHARWEHVPVWLFHGPMGAGKTTLIRSLGACRGVSSTVQSPTFSMVNEYTDQGGEPIYHFDCYRLDHVHQALDMGLEEYLSSGYSCWIEWPERIEALWPPSYIQLTFQFISPTERRLEGQWVQN